MKFWLYFDLSTIGVYKSTVTTATTKQQTNERATFLQEWINKSIFWSDNLSQVGGDSKMISWGMSLNLIYYSESGNATTPPRRSRSSYRGRHRRRSRRRRFNADLWPRLWRTRSGKCDWKTSSFLSAHQLKTCPRRTVRDLSRHTTGNYSVGRRERQRNRLSHAQTNGKNG